MRTHYSNKDLNHRDIAEALKKMGAEVIDSSSVGGGFPDMVVMYGQQIYLVEVKNLKTKYGRKGLNPLQQRIRDSGWPIAVLTSLDDAVAFINERAHAEEKAARHRTREAQK